MDQIERIEYRGQPTDEEKAALEAAIRELIRKKAEQARPSKWKQAGRAEATGRGLLDVRREATGGWIGALRLPWSGQRYAGRHGRGDAR